MEQEKIYVVVPVYKVEAYLERCVESILNQTYKNYELILVDDGSPDNCPAICDRYAEQHDHITVIHQENGGLSAARNAGIEYALSKGNGDSEWINFIDSDDFVHPRYLEYLYRAAKETGTDISSCGFVRTEATEIDSSEIGELKYECLTPEEYWCRNFTNATVAWGKLYRMFLFEDMRFPAGKIYEDNFTTYKILFHQSWIAATLPTLYYWYTNISSITRSEWSMKQLDALEAVEGQLCFFKENGYDAAYKASVRELFRHSTKNIISVRGLSPKYDFLAEDLKIKRNSAFKLLVKEIGLCHAIAYWFEIRIIKAMKRVLKTESVWLFLRRRLRELFHIRHVEL